jgi:hypothetical protein
VKLGLVVFGLLHLDEDITATLAHKVARGGWRRSSGVGAGTGARTRSPVVAPGSTILGLGPNWGSLGGTSSTDGEWVLNTGLNSLEDEWRRVMIYSSRLSVIDGKLGNRV